MIFRKITLLNLVFKDKHFILHGQFYLTLKSIFNYLMFDIRNILSIFAQNIKHYYETRENSFVAKANIDYRRNG